jgi:hypothetical protein
VAIDFAKNGARAVILVAQSVRSLQGSRFFSAGNYGSLLF